ncbi:MAG: NADH-quinone oxidoreductase subunit C [Rhodoferax sp.]|nr:NADH-quinone oxidoreductase subunit C [Rhodoferax sp.]
MTVPAMLTPLLNHLMACGAQISQLSSALLPAQRISVAPDLWQTVAQSAQALDFRWVALWADDVRSNPDEIPTFSIHVCLEKSGAYLVATTQVTGASPHIASHTPFYAGADRLERHVHDLLGIVFDDHPDQRRWCRHQAWGEADFPLRRDVTVQGQPPAQTPADQHYNFLLAQGGGVYEIPVGPVHAGIIEPGHFRFQAVGETVLRLEERLGYTHKGVEKIAQGRDAAALARLAGRVSGDSTVAHTWAACQAMERAAQLELPPRAYFLRALMCERERVANHLGDLGAMLNDIGFAFGAMQFGRLRELWQRMSNDVFGHRFMMDCIRPGGVARDLAQPFAASLRVQTDAVREQVQRLMSIINSLPSVADRVRGAGILKPEYARALGCLGFVGRACGHNVDVRRDAPYPPYDQLEVTTPLHHFGDVNARARVRLEEMTVSFDLLDSLLDDLPGGACSVAWRAPAANAEGLGLVEGWRGEILSYVRFGEAGRIACFFPRDPSWTTWPALELLIHDNIVPDFPVCNKSVNGSYSGVDL